MWEEHTYHYKSELSHRKLAIVQHAKGKRSRKDARLNRNMFLTAEEAHNLDPTYVVRAAIHTKEKRDLSTFVAVTRENVQLQFFDNFTS